MPLDDFFLLGRGISVGEIQQRHQGTHYFDFRI
jgi:hypothetical protein